MGYISLLGLLVLQGSAAEVGMLPGPSAAKEGNETKCLYGTWDFQETKYCQAECPHGMHCLTEAAYWDLDEFPRDGMGCSMSLVSAVTYGMFLLALSSQRRFQVLQNQSWKTLHMQISIFSSVLAYQAIRSLFAPEEQKEAETKGFDVWEAFTKIVWTLGGSIAWMVFMHAVMCGAYRFWTGDLEKASPRRKAVTCWGMLFGHIVGFANITFFGAIQQSLYEWSEGGHQGFWTCMSVPLIVLMLAAWYRALSFLRTQILEWLALGKEIAEAIREIIEEIENDGISLTISFLVCQVFRLMAGGVMPDAEGEEPREEITPFALQQHHSIYDMIKLSLLCFMWFSALLLLHSKKPINCQKDSEETKRVKERIDDIVVDSASMTIAWVTFYLIIWTIDALHAINESPSAGGMTGRLVTASIATTFAYVVIFLAWLAAGMIPKEMYTKREALKGIMKAMGLLIGFAWEKSFDTAVEYIANYRAHRQPWMSPAQNEILLAVFVCSIVIAVRREFVIPRVTEIDLDDRCIDTYRVPVEDEDMNRLLPLLKPLLGDMVENEAKVQENEDEDRRKMEKANAEIEEMDQEFEAAFERVHRHWKDLKVTSKKAGNNAQERKHLPINLNNMRHLLNSTKELADFKFDYGLWSEQGY